MKLLLLLPLALFTLCVGHTGAEPAPASPTKEIDLVTLTQATKAPRPALPITGRKVFLWEVKSKTNVIYLFGTIHVGKESFYPLPPQVEAALKQSQRLVVEADISNTDALAGIGKIINYQAPDGLDKHISMPLYRRLQAQLVRLKVPVDAARSMKPFLIGGLLSIAEYARLGYDMDHGVDSYLMASAKQTDTPILELESQAAQLKMMSGMPPKLQEAFLENAIRLLESGRAAEQVTGIVNAWQSGDVALMQTVVAAADRDALMREPLEALLIHGRHEAMLKKITGYLEGDISHFVALGSLHLLGPRGLVELLKARGFEVGQL